MKSLKDISWDVTEEEYRADSALSYSTLSTFFKEGPRCIPYLKVKKESEALRFGSLVDCLLLESDTFKDRYIVADVPKLTDAVLNIVSILFRENSTLYRSIDTMPDAIVLDVIKREQYGNPVWADQTRIKDIIKKGNEYYKLLYLATDKVIMSTEDFNTAQRCVEELKDGKFTKEIFRDHILEFSKIEAINQLKFRSDTVASYPVRCMFDRIVVDHSYKTIRPIDLKTTGKSESSFEDSFETWNYWIQATMYTQILRDVLDKDEYFKDFKILPYYFTIINRYDLAPMTWEFDLNHAQTDFISTTTGKVCKHWKNLLSDLVWHIDNCEYKYTRDILQNNGFSKIKTFKTINTYDN